MLKWINYPQFLTLISRYNGNYAAVEILAADDIATCNVTGDIAPANSESADNEAAKNRDSDDLGVRSENAATSLPEHIYLVYYFLL